MAKGEELDKAKLVKLLGVARELQTKLTAILEEVDELLGGGAGVASQLRNFQRQFDELWCGRYARGQHGRYIWRHAMDVPNIKRLLKALGYDDLVDRAGRYIATEDDFLKRNRHPFGLFVSGINSYAGEGKATDLALDAAGPVDCRHSPRCASEQQHTKKKQTELRA